MIAYNLHIGLTMPDLSSLNRVALSDKHHPFLILLIYEKTLTNRQNISYLVDFSSLFRHKAINHFLVILKSGFGDGFPTE